MKDTKSIMGIRHSHKKILFRHVTIKPRPMQQQKSIKTNLFYLLRN